MILVLAAAHMLTVIEAAANERLSFTTRRVLHDPATGLALYGIDPLSYFIVGTPMPGDVQVEAVRFGVIWRFESVSNRAAFEANPEVYAPQFGGYDGFRLLSGHLAEGNPGIFEIDQNRLILFATELNRRSWRQATDDRHEQARLNWRRLRSDLPR